jgi:LmbE family N-acetylglucosaminyl deacetylase
MPQPERRRLRKWISTMNRRLILLLFIIAVARGPVSKAQDKFPASVPGRVSNRVLLVVAHPDDESEMAGTIYRITNELSGVVDQVIISDGEGGFRYSSLAGRYYGADLASEPVGRALLPRIRRDEARRAARILGIQRQWFLNERDDHFTLNVEEVFQKSWRTDRVEQWLVQKLRKGRYDLVFVLLPTEDTHGQHKAASIIALKAVQQIPEDRRPAIVGVQASPKETASYKALPGYPITATISATPEFHFDREVHFGFHNSLSYQIVVDWVIAEHKSQGLFQTTYGQNRFENFWVFSVGGSPSNKRASTFIEEIAPSKQTGEPAGSVLTAK